MKNQLFNVTLVVAVVVFSLADAFGQLTLTSVSDPELGSTKISAVSVDQQGQTLLLAGKKIYTYTDHVTNVFTCTPCFDILDVAMVEDTMYIANGSAGIVKRFGDNAEVITSLRADRLVSGNDDKLYGVAKIDGIVYWDGMSWENLTMDNSSIPTDGIYDVELDQDGLLWIASQEGLISWDGTTFSLRPVPSELSSAFYDVVVDSDNSVWVASAFGGVGKYSESEWTVYTSTFGALERVENLSTLHGNEIWTSESTEGLFRYTVDFEAIPYDDLGVTEWQQNRVLYGDEQNRLWIQNDFTPLRYLTTSPTSTIEFETILDDISLFPNPANDRIEIKCLNESEFFTDLEFYTMEGKMIFHPQVHAESDIEINVSNWKSGIYTIRISTNKGFTVKKINKL